MQTKRVLIAVFAVAVVAAGALSASLWLAKRAEATAAASAPAEPPLLRTVAPQLAAIAAALELPARTAPVEQALLFARANGIVAERRADLGDRVAAGQVLAVIAAPDMDRAVERARASVKQARAQEELAQTNLDRTQALVARGFLSRQVLDERRSNLKAAHADREVAQAEANRLGALQSFQVVRAPFAGIVAERRIDRGDRVSGDQSQPGSHLFRIVRLNQLRVEVDAPQSAALRLQVGSATEVRFTELPGERFAARVDNRAGIIDPRSGTMRVELLMANPNERIPAGMVGRVALNLANSQAALLVPGNSVVIRSGSPQVALVDAQNAIRFTPVRLGQTQGDKVEILEGLNGASKVVVSPNGLLRDGDRVRIAAPAEASKDSG